MTKYRIRLKNGRVIGPFVKTQLFELKSKGHIIGQEEAQIFPTGDWKPIQQLDFYEEIMDPNRTIIDTQTTKEETFVFDLAKLRNERNQKEIEKIDVTSHQVVELTETVRLQNSPGLEKAPVPPEQKYEIELDIEPSQAFEAPPIEKTSNHNKTLINPVAQQEIEKMRRQKKLEEERLRAEEEDRAIQELSRVRKAEEAKLIALDESTQMIQLDNFSNELLVSAQEEDQKFELEVKEIKKKRKQEIDDENAEDEDEEDEESPEALAKKKKKNKIIMIAAAVAIMYVVLFPSSEKGKKPPFQNLPPQISFPIPFDKADSKVATIEYEKGRQFFATGSYVNLVKAGIHLKNSYENNLENEAALNLLVRSYAEQLEYSRNQLVDAQVIFNMIQGKRPFLAKDPNGVIGMNLFYMAIKKYEAAADVVAKYLKLYPSNVTQDLFAVYLKSLMKIGKIDLAKKFYLALKKAEKKNRYVYDALIEYSILNQETEEAYKYADEAIKLYPQLSMFYLDKADLLIRDKKIKDADPLLAKVDALNFENNDFFRAKFLELAGLQFASRGDAKTATLYFSESLKIKDSTDLRMKLSELSGSDNPQSDTEKLIAESKAYKHLIVAQDFYDKRRYELALSAAARATDSLPGHIPSELFLAKVQLRLGLAKQAIATLETLLKKYPEDKGINFGLIDAYIETYKFNDARTRIGIISGSDLKSTWEFASINAKLYIQMGDSLQAISWLRNSMSANPLNDYDIFLLAEILIKRASFDAARALLNKCMELDPVNADYRIANARIIYEQQDDQAAVGYLLGLLDEFGEDPKILAEIAIFYFRAGKVKDFQAYKEKLEKLPVKDKALYEFLIKAALLDERYDDIPVLVEQLLKIEPGELESMMTAGRVLFETGKFTEAGKWFLRIQQKMDTYPKVQYYIAKIKYYAKDYDGAMVDVEKDLKSNGENDADLALLGLIYIEKGNILEAENAFKKAQKINPKSYEALIGMAEISTKRNNFDLALDLYKRAMKEKGDESVIHKKIGDVYRLLGQGSLAVESYKMYLEMHSEAPDKKQIESYINLMQ